MNTINGQKNSPKFLTVIGLFVLCLVILFVMGLLVYFELIPATFAVISLALSIILPIHQKRLSIYSVTALVAGLLFFASAIIEFGFSAFTQHMSILDRMKFSAIMRPDQVSQGLASIGVGILIIVHFSQILRRRQSLGMTGLFRFQLVIGIFLFLFGAYIVFSGLRPW
jgi:hypothetical protein